MKDPVVEEVRRHRDELAAKHNYDIKAMFAAARAEQMTCGHEVVDLSKKRKTA